jgi:hypothetical protein
VKKPPEVGPFRYAYEATGASYEKGMSDDPMSIPIVTEDDALDADMLGSANSVSSGA